jgi:outer membrane biosynthesis protein TonB
MFSASFDNTNKAFEQRKNLTSLAITIAIHALIVFILIMYKLTLPDPPFEDNEGGMSVNFGFSEVGTGDEQAMSYTPIAAETPPAEQAPTPQPVAKEEELATQDLEDAPVLENKPVKPVTKPVVTTPTPTPVKPVTKPNPVVNNAPPKPAVDENAMFNPGAFGKPNNSKGDGEGGGQGDQGALNGDPNSRNYKGSGDGNGNGNGSGLGDGNVRLAGRSLRYKPTVNDKSQAKGKVVITIQVNKKGEVVDARYTQAGSTTSDNGLVQSSLEAARKYRFDESPNAAEKQTGTIVFIYKVN